MAFVVTVEFDYWIAISAALFAILAAVNYRGIIGAVRVFLSKKH